MQILFDADVEDAIRRRSAQSLTYAPIVFMALVALLWGTRGATLAAFLGALIAIVNTAQGEGPFADRRRACSATPELEVQGYALAIALTGLLIAVLDAGKRDAMRDARALADAVHGGDRRASIDRLRMGSGQRPPRA